MSRRKFRDDADYRLYCESIPHRLTPAPTAHRGPSTRRSQEELALAASPVLATVHQIHEESA